MSYDGPVPHTPDLDRIIKLPRRELDFTSPEAVNLAWAWSPQLHNENGRREWTRITALPPAERVAEFARFARKRADGGENCPLLLKTSQAIILYEAHHNQGVFASASVGEGKTLLAWLFALILGAPRPVLIVPGGLEAQTHEDFADLGRFWLAPRPTPEITTYETLSNPSNPLLLCDCSKCAGTKEEPKEPGGLRPTHFIADECDKFRNPTAACTRRAGRFMSKHPTTVYCGMTGTAWRKSIKNSAPQLLWALKYRAPIPLSYMDMQYWSDALDLSTRGERRDPGALTWLAGVDPKTVATYAERLEIAAEGFQRRLLETPGVIQTEGQSCDQPLTIRLLKAPDDPLLDAEFHRFRHSKKTLDGWDVDDPLSELAYGTQIGAGFFYFWNPRPPLEWIEARSAAATVVREKIAQSSRSGRPLDTKAQVYRSFPDDPILREWQEIEPSFIPNTVARPITASVLGYALAWIKLNGPAIVWVKHEYIGSALSAMSGVPFFGSEGKDASGRYIMKHSPKQSAIVSLSANMRGRNLQAWHKNLILSPVPAATAWEQGYLGRTHRQNQRNHVFADVILSCAEDIRAIRSAHAEAVWARSRGGPVQKLLIAKYDWSHFPVEQLATLPPDHPSRDRWVRAGG